MEITDEMKQKAIDVFIDSMEKSEANAAVSQYFLAMDTALTDALIAVVKDLPEPDVFSAGDRVEVIGDVEDVDEVTKGMTGTVLFYRKSRSGEDTDTNVKIDGIKELRADFWFYGEKELKKIDA